MAWNLECDFVGVQRAERGGEGGWEVMLLGGKDSRHWVELPRLGKILPFALLLSALLARGLCFSGLISHWRPSKHRAAESVLLRWRPPRFTSIQSSPVHFTSLHLTSPHHIIPFQYHLPTPGACASVAFPVSATRMTSLGSLTLLSVAAR